MYWRPFTLRKASNVSSGECRQLHRTLLNWWCLSNTWFIQAWAVLKDNAKGSLSRWSMRKISYQITLRGRAWSIETFSIRQTANNSLQFHIRSFALPRLQVLARRSVQFSSLLFSQNIIQYKNTYRNCKVAREPRRNQKADDKWAPQSQRNKQNKMKSRSDALKIGTKQRLMS